MISRNVQLALATSLLILHLYGFLFMLQMFREKQKLLMKRLIISQSRVSKQKMRLKKIRLLCRKKRSMWCANGRDDTWWKNMFNGKCEESEWKLNFRLNRDDFYALHAAIAEYIAPKHNTPNPIAVSSLKKLAITLYYLKDMGSIRVSANQFGVAKCTAARIIHQTCSVIVEHMGPELIKLPTNADEMREKVAQFECKFGMKQAFGAVDGTQIPIRRPSENSQDYFCYKR